MDFLIIFIVLMLAIFAFVGWIVYWAISHSAKKNKVYQAFASEHGYQFDKAQGNDYYREYSKQKTSNDLTLKLFQNPYVEKYANFNHYPFGRGNMVKVAYVISMVLNFGLSPIILREMQLRILVPVVFSALL